MRGTHIKVAAVEHKSSSRIFLSFQALGFMICDLCLLWRLRHLRGRCWQWNNNLTACSNNNESHAINDRFNAKVTAKLAQKRPEYQIKFKTWQIELASAAKTVSQY